MKRLIIKVMAVGLLMACGGGSTDTMRRLRQAEDVVEEHPDSAAGPSPPPSPSSAPPSAACAQGSKGGRGKVFRFAQGNYGKRYTDCTCKARFYMANFSSTFPTVILRIS